MVMIRELRDADGDAFRELVLRLHETLRPLDPDLAPGESIIERYLEWMIGQVAASGGSVFVADEAGTLVGYVIVLGHVPPGEPDEVEEPHAIVLELFVEETRRRDRVGAMLMDRAEDHARSVGASKIRLRVLARNAAAADFYDRLGYSERLVEMTKRL